MKETIKKIQAAVNVTVDGIFGNQTLQAVADRLNVAATIRNVQHATGATVDGVFGPKTAACIAAALGIAWPTQEQVRSGKSIFGRAGDESNLVSIVPPYQLYYDGRPVKTIRVHRLIQNSVIDALTKIKEAYTPAAIHALGLDRYDGAYNYRPTRSGKTLSMHAWGIAIDFNAAENSLHQTKESATLAKPECAAFWAAWESVGAVSLGRQKNYDWMHVQFATL